MDVRLPFVAWPTANRFPPASAIVRRTTPRMWEMSSSVPAIGARDVLLHIGPHKTGTTAIQTALHRDRAGLARLGVTYPGSPGLHANAARAVTKFASSIGTALPPDSVWRELVRQVNAAPARTVVSSEFFDVADGPTIRRIADDIGSDRIQVVLTATALGRVMTSSWQQAVRSRGSMTIDRWVRRTLEKPRHPRSATFWKRQRLDHQVQRWAEVVGADRIHLVLTDKSQPRLLFSAFEQMLGLPEEFLVPSDQTANRSLTTTEIELVRRLNERIYAETWSDQTHARFVRLGVVRELVRRTPGPNEGRITLPAWAAPAVNEIATEMIANLRDSGATIIGDLDSLLIEQPHDDATAEAVDDVPIDLAIEAILGTMKAGGAGILQERSVNVLSLREYPGIASAPRSMLVAELRQRASRSLKRRLRLD